MGAAGMLERLRLGVSVAAISIAPNLLGREFKEFRAY
jgi:hypothetical protein